MIDCSLVRGLVPAQTPVGGAGAEAGGGAHHVVEGLLQQRWRGGGWGPCRRPESLPTHAAMEGWDLGPAWGSPYLDLRLPQRLDWLPRLDMLELLLLERGEPDLPRQLGTLPPCWNTNYLSPHTTVQSGEGSLVRTSTVKGRKKDKKKSFKKSFKKRPWTSSPDFCRDEYNEPSPQPGSLQEKLGEDSCCSAAGWRNSAFCVRWSDVWKEKFSFS